MYAATSRPSGVSSATAARSRSPEEMCSTPSSSASRMPWVPLPPPGGASISTLISARDPSGLSATSNVSVWRATLRRRDAPEMIADEHRDRLPQLGDDLFLTDGGIETVLIFHDGLDLPAFAAFDLLKDEAGTDALRRYYAPYLALAAEHGAGFVAESPTWRASPRWARELGYDARRARRASTARRSR